MRTGHQSCGWWMRRPTGYDHDSVVAYYTDVVGLREMRVGPAVTLLWAGEDIVFEIKSDDDPGTVRTSLAEAPLLPILRSHDLAATRARCESAGYTDIVTERTRYATRIWVTGADGLQLGFEQRDAAAPLSADVEALRRWQAGEVTLLDGLDPLPGDLHYLSRARRRVADLDAVATFYRDVVGLDQIGTEAGDGTGEAVLFELGDTVLLELVDGGSAAPPPTDRNELVDSFILRVHDFDRCVAELSAAGAQWVGPQIRYETGSSLAYFADPEGLVVGIEERSSYGDYVDDVEANRRWAARHPDLA